jgi:hypothetical protein
MPLLILFGAASARGFGLCTAPATVLGSITLLDPYFPYVSLWLDGNGANGTQNNTFLDSSANTFSITRNGNTTQGSFSPFGGTWSNYFPGSGNYLTMTDSTAFDLSGGTYTIEMWIYPTGDYGNYNTIIAKRANGGNPAAWEVYLRIGSGVLSFYNGSNYESTVTPTANVWSHVAAVYDGAFINLYLNGTRVYRSSMANTNISGPIQIGTYPYYDERYIGYISNLRITKGAALYSGGSLTVPTAPLTNATVSGTVSLLTCQSNRFIDTSANAAAITVVGTPSVQRFSPASTITFAGGTTTSYSGRFIDSPASTVYYNTSTTALGIGSGQFTYEAWVYPTGYRSPSATIFSNYNAAPGADGIGMGISSTGVLGMGENSGISVISGGTVPLNT